MHRLSTEPKVIGTKQTIRALDKGIAHTLFVAKDAQKQVVIRVLELAEHQEIPIVYVDTMEELGNACNIEVKTATVALINT